MTVTFDDVGTTRCNDDAEPASVTITVGSAKMIFKVNGQEMDSIARAQSGTFY